MATNKSTSQRPFGFKEFKLPADEYGLDEDGWIWLRVKISVGMSLAVSESENQDDIENWLPQLVGGWSIKAYGVELPFAKENCMELPVEILKLIMEEITAPLAEAAQTLPTK